MPGERRTLIVTVLTALMMGVEVAAGLVFGSMALLADGLHMASHAAALAIAYAAYVIARRYAGDERFSFGTGKMNSLAGFAGALLLTVFAVLMVWESTVRFLNPVPIQFNQATVVAVIGLVVNAVSAMILGHRGQAGHTGPAGHEDTGRHRHLHDHNLRSAYLHVLADALTSFLAIFALLAGKYGGANWLDPAMGVVGAVLVARWSLGLIRDSSAVLLDRQAPADTRRGVRDVIESDGQSRVTDLHIWSVAPTRRAAVLLVVTEGQSCSREYRRRLEGAGWRFDHLIIEVERLSDESEPAGGAVGG